MKYQIIFTIVTVLVMFALLQVVNIVYKKIFSEKKSIHLKFMRSFCQIFIVIICLYNIGMQFEAFQTFSATLLMSSSLLVVVLGFAFQTSLEDFIAGILISIFKPFEIEDRVTLTEHNISGYIENITIRHTVIRTFNNSRLIIPNSKMNKEIIENTHLVDPTSTGFMDALITYDSDIQKAKEIMAKVICSHPMVVDTRTEQQKANNEPQITIFIRELGDNGISLRGNVITKDIDYNFKACSEIREQLLIEFKKNGIEFAYPHMTIDGKLSR